MQINDYQDPSSIDPTTIHVPDPNGSVLDNLRFALYSAKQAALSTDQYVLINFHVKNDEPSLKFTRMPREEFDLLPLQCPRAADILFQQQEGQPRQVPSSMVTPEGHKIVSKPGLCGGCQHDLHRRVHGHCSERAYLPYDYQELSA